MTPEELDLLEKMRIRRRELVKQKNWYGALEVIDISLSIQETFDRYYNKGIILLQLGQPDLAIEAFEKSLKMKPDFAKGKQGLVKAIELQQKNREQQILENSNNHYENIKTVDHLQQDTIDLNHNELSLPSPKETAKVNQIPPLPETEEGKKYYEERKQRQESRYNQQTIDYDYSDILSPNQKAVDDVHLQDYNQKAVDDVHLQDYNQKTVDDVHLQDYNQKTVDDVHLQDYSRIIRPNNADPKNKNKSPNTDDESMK